MKQSQTSTSISSSVKGGLNYSLRAVVQGALKPALLAVVAAIVTAGCKTQAITPPGGAGMPMPPSSGGMPAPGGGSSGSSGSSSGSSGGSSGSSGGSSGSSGGSSGDGGSSGSSGGSSGSSGGSSGSSGGSSGSVGSVPQIEMPGGFPGADGGADGDADGDGDGDGDGDSNSDCGDTGNLPGGVGGMGQAGECLGGGASSANDSDSEAASDSSGGGDGSDGGGAVTGTGGAGGTVQFPAESDAERAERLGRELEESVGGFDQVLMEEQREIAAVGRSTEGFGGGGSGSGSGGISLGEQSDGGSSGGSVTIANPSGPTRESPIAGMSDQEIRERTPDDIPVTVDDDIISRQLREAALAEEDPELRERLWVEYRKYRGL